MPNQHYQRGAAVHPQAGPLAKITASEVKTLNREAIGRFCQNKTVLPREGFRAARIGQRFGLVGTNS
jgi:hypothetical protein